jgi:hypothetical protein
MFESIISWLFGCHHSSLGLPYGGFQRCLSCGAQRQYAIGEQAGAWHKERPVSMEIKAV